MKTKPNLYPSPISYFIFNRPFSSSKKSHFQNEAQCEAIDMKMIFNYYANKTHFHNKGFALSLVLKVRFFETRKWPIPCFVPIFYFPVPVTTSRKYFYISEFKPSLIQGSLKERKCIFSAMFSLPPTPSLPLFKLLGIR